MKAGSTVAYTPKEKVGWVRIELNSYLYWMWMTLGVFAVSLHAVLLLIKLWCKIERLAIQDFFSSVLCHKSIPYRSSKPHFNKGFVTTVIYGIYWCNITVSLWIAMASGEVKHSNRSCYANLQLSRTIKIKCPPPLLGVSSQNNSGI